MRFPFLCALAPLRETITWKGDVMTENEIAREIVDAAYKVHVALGPGHWSGCTR